MTLHLTLVLLFLFKCFFFSFTQESLLLYQMGNLEGCKQLSEDVCNQAVNGKCFVWCLQTGKEVYEG